jgi:hypothetical protein
VLPPDPQTSPSIVDALIDPAGDPRYGRGGTEAEYHGGYLEFPAHMDDPDADSRIAVLERSVPWLARNVGRGLKVVIDIGTFDVLQDGSVAMDGTARTPVDFKTTAPILEVVSDPLAELRNDPSANTTSTLETAQRLLSRLDNMPRSAVATRGTNLADIFPARHGWEVHPNAAAVKFVPVTVGGSASLSVQHTKGVPLGAVAQFMRGIAGRIWAAQQREFHRDGEAFAVSVVESFRSTFSPRFNDGLAHPAGRPPAEELRDLEGAMWLTYVHVAGLAMSTTVESIGGKAFSAVALRQSLRSLRGELSPRAVNFLHDNADLVRLTFESHFLSRVPDFSSHYVDARNLAVAKHAESPRYHSAPPPLAGGSAVRPLQAVRYARLPESHRRDTLMVGDYLDTMLLHNPPATVNQHEAFGVHTYFDDLDRARAGERGLLLLELRNDKQRLITPAQLSVQYSELTGIVRGAVELVEPAAESTLGRQVSQVWNLARGRFGAAGDQSGWPLSATGHTAESLAARYPWLGEVNPERGSAGGQTNCVISAIAFVLSEREGQSFEAPHTESLPGEDLLNFHRQSLGLADDEHQVSVIPSLHAAAEAMNIAGSGAMALIAVRGPDTGIDHVYVAVVDEYGVSFLDPQRGTVAADPIDATGLAMLPLSQGIPVPPGARPLTAQETAASTNSDTPGPEAPKPPRRGGQPLTEGHFRLDGGLAERAEVSEPGAPPAKLSARWTASRVSEHGPGTVTAGSATTAHATWNAFHAADGGHAKDVLDAVLGRLHQLGTDYGRDEDEVKVAYGQLEAGQKKGNIPELVEYLYNQVLIGRPKVRLLGGSRSEPHSSSTDESNTGSFAHTYSDDGPSGHGGSLGDASDPSDSDSDSDSLSGLLQIQWPQVRQTQEIPGDQNLAGSLFGAASAGVEASPTVHPADESVAHNADPTIADPARAASETSEPGAQPGSSQGNRVDHSSSQTGASNLADSGSDGAVDAHTAYAHMAPGLKSFVTRDAFGKEEFSAAREAGAYTYFTDFARATDGELTDEAVSRYAQLITSHFIGNLQDAASKAGILVEGLDDAMLAEVVRGDDPQIRSMYPELLAYFDPDHPNQPLQVDGNVVLTSGRQDHEGVDIRYHFSERDPWAQRRLTLVRDALSMLAASGYSLPPILNVHLPLYHRSLVVRPNPKPDAPLDITPTSAIDGFPKNQLATLAVPDVLFVSQEAAAPRPLGYLGRNPHAVYDAMADAGLGIVLHELMHWLHFHNRKALFADLDSTTIRPERRESVAEVSHYALAHPHEFVAEYGVSRLLGRSYPPSVTAQLEQLYHGLGGPDPDPKRTVSPRSAPRLTDEQLAFLTDRMHEIPGLEGVDSTTIEAVEQSLAPFDRWLNLTRRAELVADALSARPLDGEDIGRPTAPADFGYDQVPIERSNVDIQGGDSTDAETNSAGSSRPGHAPPVVPAIAREESSPPADRSTPADGARAAGVASRDPFVVRPDLDPKEIVEAVRRRFERAGRAVRDVEEHYDEMVAGLNPVNGGYNSRELETRLYDFVATGKLFNGLAGGAQGLEVEIGNIGVVLAQGTGFPDLAPDQVLARSRDGLVELRSDRANVFMGADGNVYGTAEARTAAGVAAAPYGNKNGISILEIVTKPGRTLDTDWTQESLAAIHARRDHLISRLREAPSSHGNWWEAAGARLEVLLGADYEVVEQFRDTRISVFPRVHSDVPLYVQFTEDVPLAGIYPFLDHVAYHPRPDDDGLIDLRTSLAFASNVAAQMAFVAAQQRGHDFSPNRLDDLTLGDLDMLVDPEFRSVMGVLALAYIMAAGVARTNLYGTQIFKASMDVVPRLPLRVLAAALSDRARNFLLEHQDGIHDQLEGHFRQDVPTYPLGELSSMQLTRGDGKTTFAVGAVLDQILDRGPALLPAGPGRWGTELDLFGITAAGHDLKARGEGPDAMPPLVALEARYYNTPRYNEPVSMRNRSDEQMMNAASAELVDVTVSIDRDASTAHLMHQVPLGRAVHDALADVLFDRLDRRPHRIALLQKAIRKYLDEHRQMSSDVSRLLAPASKRLGVDLVSVPDERFALEFDKEAKNFDGRQAELTRIATHVVERAAHAHAAGDGRKVVVSVVGGGNGGRRSKGPQAVGEDRANAVRVALEKEVSAQIRDHPHLQQAWTIQSRTRGRSFPEGITPTGVRKVDDAARRRVEVIVVDGAATTNAWNLASSGFGEATVDPGDELLASGHTEESLAARYPWLGAVNPKPVKPERVNPERVGPERVKPEPSAVAAPTNCVMAAFAFVISEREGSAFEAPLTEALPGADLVNFHRQSLGLGEDQHQVSRIPNVAAAQEALAAAGPGAMALIAVRGAGEDLNHVFVGVVDELGVSFLDPQTGGFAKNPVKASALAMLPLTRGIGLPKGARWFTDAEVTVTPHPQAEDPAQRQQYSGSRRAGVDTGLSAEAVSVASRGTVDASRGPQPGRVSGVGSSPRPGADDHPSVSAAADGSQPEPWNVADSSFGATAGDPHRDGVGDPMRASSPEVGQNDGVTTEQNNGSSTEGGITGEPLHAETPASGGGRPPHRIGSEGTQEPPKSNGVQRQPLSDGGPVGQSELLPSPVGLPKALELDAVKTLGGASHNAGTEAGPSSRPAGPQGLEATPQAGTAAPKSAAKHVDAPAPAAAPLHRSPGTSSADPDVERQAPESIAVFPETL